MKGKKIACQTLNIALQFLSKAFHFYTPLRETLNSLVKLFYYTSSVTNVRLSLIEPSGILSHKETPQSLDFFV